MNKRLIIKVTFLLFTSLLLPACAITHKINIKAIEANKNKIFKLGIVKVAGRMPILFFGDNVDKKIMALEKIPIKEICDILSSNYGLQINTEINKTVKIVKERTEGQRGPGPPPCLPIWPFMSKNPYWGNREYKTGFTGCIRWVLTGDANIIENEDIGDIVNITYGYNKSSGVFKDVFYYEIIVKSDGIVLIHHKDTVAVVDTPMNGLEGTWKNLVSYADKITEVLVKDINKTK